MPGAQERLPARNSGRGRRSHRLVWALGPGWSVSGEASLAADTRGGPQARRPSQHLKNPIRRSQGSMCSRFLPWVALAVVVDQSLRRALLPRAA